MLPQLWFRNTWSWDDGCAKPALRCTRQTASIGGAAPRAGRLPAVSPTAARSCCSATTRPTSGGCTGSETRSGYFKDAFHEYVVHGNREAVNPAQHGHQGGGALRARACPAGGERHVRLRLDRSTRHASPSPISTRSSSSGGARPMSSTPICRTDIADDDARRVQRQAFAGMIWSKQFYYYDVPRVAGRRSRASRRRRRSARTAATASGRTSTTPTSSRCRTSGSIPGTPPGTWPSTASRWRCRSRVRQGPARAADARVVHAPERPAARPTSGRFGDVNPPVHAWAAWRVFQIDRKQRRRRRRPRLPRARLPQAAAQLHLVGEPQGRRRAATSSRAASWAWTTSACSTAARRCRPAATSTRPTAPAGWRCTA